METPNELLKFPAFLPQFLAPEYLPRVRFNIFLDLLT